MPDWITCRAGLSIDKRRRLHTQRVVCETMVCIDGHTVPIICPTCGSRVM